MNAGLSERYDVKHLGKSGLLNAHILNSGESMKDISDSYANFITENDVVKGNQPIYPVERDATIGEEFRLIATQKGIMENN